MNQPRHESTSLPEPGNDKKIISSSQGRNVWRESRRGLTLMKEILFVAVALTGLLAVPLEAADSVAGKKVLFVSSYHDGLDGADDVVAGIKEGFQGSGVKLTFTYMDTKRNPSESYAKESALRVRTEFTKPHSVQESSLPRGNQ